MAQLRVLTCPQSKKALWQELSFQDTVSTEVVASILDHVVVCEGSTKQRIDLELYLRLGQTASVAFSRGEICILEHIFFTMCATRRRLCSMSTLRASRSPAAKRSKYAFSSAAESGRGNEPGLPARRRRKQAVAQKPNGGGKHTSTPPSPYVGAGSPYAYALRRRPLLSFPIISCAYGE